MSTSNDMHQISEMSEISNAAAPADGQAGHGSPEHEEPWRDPAIPAAARIAELLRRMTLEEKIAQLGSIWMGASGDGDGVAPM
jgi:hypothetical protein